MRSLFIHIPRVAGLVGIVVAVGAGLPITSLAADFYVNDGATNGDVYCTAPGQGGADHRYRLARWTGTRWQDGEVGYAGSRLYAGEDDYTGGFALVPGAPSVVFVSTNAHPATGEPLVSRQDGRRHWELFRGESKDGHEWQWQALTRDSTVDNIRPVVPRASGEPIVLWLRGSYRSYTDYDLELVALLP